MRARLNCRTAAARFGVAPSTPWRLRRGNSKSVRYGPRALANDQAAASWGRTPALSSPGVIDARTLPYPSWRLFCWKTQPSGRSVEPFQVTAQGGLLPLNETLLASEKERSDARDKRYSWCKYCLPAIQAQPARLAFVDETNIKTNMAPLRGPCPERQSWRLTHRLANATTGRLLLACAAPPSSSLG